jgi:hypothetical protein
MSDFSRSSMDFGQDFSLSMTVALTTAANPALSIL